MKNQCAYSSSETDSDEETVLEPTARCLNTSRQCMEYSNKNYPDLLRSTKYRTITAKSDKKRSKTEEPKIQTLNIASHSKVAANSKQEETNNILEINSGEFENFYEIENRLNREKKFKTLKLIDCSIKTPNKGALSVIDTLTDLVFIRCDENTFKAFSKQETLLHIEVNNDDKGWNRFPHKIFNEICKSCKKLEHIVLKGAGTTDYFDCDEFPFKIKCLDTTAISHHWYVGLDSKRVTFLQSQKGNLKHLTIHELPYDFDGGEVLKYIIEEINLETFYYGKIPLILDGKKQHVKEFKSSEIQLTSTIEMLKQFPSIEKVVLEISNREISSDHIENYLKSSAYVFNNLKELAVVDNSTGSLGVFLDIFKNLENLQKFTLITDNRFINTILKCFPVMPKLEQFYLTSTAPNAPQRYETIKNFAQNLKIFSVTVDFVDEARRSFGGRIQVNANDEAKILSNMLKTD